MVKASSKDEKKTMNINELPSIDILREQRFDWVQWRMAYAMMKMQEQHENTIIIDYMERLDDIQPDFVIDNTK